MRYLLDGQETERPLFRLLEANDYDDWLPFFYNEQAINFVGLDAQKTPEELCKFWMEKCQNRYEEDRGGMNVLIDKETGKMIGQCGLLLQQVEGDEFLEIGYSLLPDYWGNGYATEAAIKLKSWGFQNTDWPQLISIIHTENIGSENVAKKNGMSNWKFLPEYNGLAVNIYRIKRDEWLNKQLKQD